MAVADDRSGMVGPMLHSCRRRARLRYFHLIIQRRESSRYVEYWREIFVEAQLMSSRRPDAQADAVAVIIATRGRPQLVNHLVQSLADQTRPPDAVFIVATCDDDIHGLDKSQLDVRTKIGRIGTAKQRNDGLDLTNGRFPYIVFFDDDFVPSRYWVERMVSLFQANADLISITGTVLADGIKTAGIPLQEGKQLVRQWDEEPITSEVLYDGFGPYGCNMAFRHAAIADVRFDERLPLYAWLEDADFGGQIRHRGRLARAEGLWGVHLGHKLGRGRGVILGYSQIVNAVYLARKGSLPVQFVANIAIRNLLVNLLRALHPEPFIDRRGRLYGNFIALADVLRGRIAPERAAEL